MEIKSILPSHLLLIHAESLLFFLNLHSVADIIQLIIPILECRTKGFTSFPPIFCFNPSPSRGSPVLAQKWHGFAVSSKKRSFVYYLFFKVSRRPVIISIFSSALNIYIYIHTHLEENSPQSILLRNRFNCFSRFFLFSNHVVLVFKHLLD